MRVGLGYDSHRFVADRPLILAGQRIPHPLGLAGHSDADAVAHA
ncbi:MAG: 2-C-methyl-D-erythritol 2,4-cyclodiphosphate synthase, partial [Gemmatimonadetes bacterium]|nr:2-C-methyl-D-erythritol 2,4-cyclodiphosphate synthase [Gemmatimonadota bacterium]